MFANLFRRTLTRERFVDRFGKHLASRPGISDVTFDEARFRFTFRTANGDQGAAFLGNAFEDAGKVKAGEIDGVIQKYVLSVLENNFSSLAEQLPSLLPIIRDPNYFALADLTVALEDRDGTKASTVPWQALAGNYAVAVAIDSENAVRPVQKKLIEEAGLIFEDLLQRAIENLRERTTPKFTRFGEGVFVSAWQDVYDASRVLLPELLHQLPLHGAPVVVLPSRNHLIAAGERDLPALTQLVALAGQVLETDTRPMAPRLLIRKDDGWYPFSRPDLDVSSFDKHRRRILHGDYAQQTTLLNALYERRNVDVFVAQQKLATSKDQAEEFTITTWSKGVETLLPVADRLSLVDLESKEVIMIKWDAAMEIAGHHLTPESDMAPLRYRVTTFPEGNELNSIRSAALFSGSSR